MTQNSTSDDASTGLGQKLALVVSVGLLGGAGVVILTGGAPALATILVLIGAGALSG
jgi:hypothetical protein